MCMTMITTHPGGVVHVQVLQGRCHAGCTPAAYRALGSCRDATHVRLDVEESWDQRDGLLAELAKLPSLKRLEVFGEGSGPTAGNSSALSVLLHVRGAEGLEALDMPHSDCTGPVGDAFALFPRLTSVKLGRTDQAAIDSLVGTQVRDLELRASHTDAAMLRALHRMTGLRRLRIEGAAAKFAAAHERALRLALPRAAIEVVVGSYARLPGDGSEATGPVGDGPGRTDPVEEGSERTEPVGGGSESTEPIEETPEGTGPFGGGSESTESGSVGESPGVVEGSD